MQIASRHVRMVGIVCSCLALLWASGCATVTTPQDPGAMNALIQIKDYEQGSTPVGVRFTTAKGETIEFVSGETVAANGQFLKYDSNSIERLIAGGGYVGEVADPGSSGTYTFTYTPSQSKGGNPVSVSVKVIPQAVKPLQPTTGATVPLPKSGPLTLTYQKSGLSNTKMLAILTDARNTTTFTLPIDENGTITVSVDQMKDFQPGPGEISLVRVTTTNPGGTEFGSVKVEYNNITKLQVTWQ